MVNRAGFTLAEVIVAITLLAVGVLSLAASGGWAAGMVRTAQREEAAARLAGALLDSLVLVPNVEPGSLTRGGVLAEWSSGPGDAITLSVRYSDAGTPRVHLWEARSLERLQGLPPAVEPRQ
jgi:prepilin-type N-terminal cleavage/methylation domain-containing protein